MSIEHAGPTHVDGVSPRGERLLTWPQLALLIPYSRQHVGRLEARGAFPRRLQIGAARVAWRESEALAWLDERARGALRPWQAGHRHTETSPPRAA